jgi:hypothetical protein
MKRAVGAHKRRAIEEVAPEFDEERWPAWAAEGVRLARAAPSAVNRQPWKFELDRQTDPPGLSPENDRSARGVTISVVARGLEGNIPRRLDCGIAMLHFEVGARLMGAPGSWESLDDPEVARYRVAETTESSSAR